MQDAEAIVDALFDAGILWEDRDGAVRTTSEFEATRTIYHDTYGHARDEEFRQAVADVFDISPNEALRRISEREVTRQSFVAYLSVRSHLDDEATYDRQEIATMADVVTELTPGTPIPDELIEVTDDSYLSFLADHPDSVVVVFKHHCDPCESLKDALDELKAAVPDHVTWAGVDGEEATDFGDTYGVEAAPTTLCFRDGDLVESKRGWASAERMVDALQDVYEE